MSRSKYDNFDAHLAEPAKPAPTHTMPHTVGFKPLFNEAVQPKAEAMTAEQFWEFWQPEYFIAHPEYWKDWKKVARQFAESYAAHVLSLQLAEKDAPYEIIEQLEQKCADFLHQLAEKDKNYRAMAESEFELRRELASLREERNKAIELLRELPITSMAMKITLAPKWVERVCGLLGGSQIEPGKAGDDK